MKIYTSTKRIIGYILLIGLLGTLIISMAIDYYEMFGWNTLWVTPMGLIGLIVFIKFIHWLID